jgi:hypothetical protein
VENKVEWNRSLFQSPGFPATSTWLTEYVDEKKSLASGDGVEQGEQGNESQLDERFELCGVSEPPTMLLPVSTPSKMTKLFVNSSRKLSTSCSEPVVVSSAVGTLARSMLLLFVLVRPKTLPIALSTLLLRLRLIPPKLPVRELLLALRTSRIWDRFSHFEHRGSHTFHSTFLTL